LLQTTVFSKQTEPVANREGAVQRIKDEFLLKLLEAVPLKDQEVLEIGCGTGTRSVEIAANCKSLVGIDPSYDNTVVAGNRNITNAEFLTCAAEDLPFDANSYDVAVFTLSLHHVPEALMAQAIDEVVRVVRPEGYIVFLEPGTQGSLFDAEIEFDAFDGDERQVKWFAYNAMLLHRRLTWVVEIPDETIFQFDSLEDFLASMSPKQKIDDIGEFLRRHNFTLNASRRINVFRPKK
jgi:ubiquinone/menaquinone biosynthesis C-methylase UbiE